MRRHIAILFTVIGLCALSQTGAAAPPPPRPPHGHPIRFPADAGLHPGAHQEWWYTVGHLVDKRGHTYGFETTIAKIGGLTKLFPSTTEDLALHTDVSVTDDAAHRFYQALRFMAPGRDALPAGSPLRARAVNATIAVVGAGGLQYRVTGSVPGARLALTLASRRPPLLVGGGFFPWGDGYTYYYSLTDLQTSGTLTIGRRQIPVHGIAWMDHQWGNWTGLGAAPPGVRHWEWMGMQLADGTDINLANVTTSAGMEGAASALLPDNRQVNLRGGVTITDLGYWRSQATGTLYPSGWRVRIPRLRLDVTVTPTVRDQELVAEYPAFGYRLHYYEGRCTVSGMHAGRHVSGTTYTELIGYGAPAPRPQI